MAKAANTEDRTERALIAALDQHRGKTLNKNQVADLKWYRKRQTTELIESALANLPKKIYCELSDRQVKVINEQADRYGLPIGGPTIDLYEAIKGFHDFLADHADLFGDDDDLRKEKMRKEIGVLAGKIELQKQDLAKNRDQVE